MSLSPPPLPFSACNPVLPPPALRSSPTSAQVVSAVAQIFFAHLVGFAAGIYFPMLMAQRFRPNKPFDDYRIPVNILLVAFIMLLCGILAGRRRIWLGLGFSIGATLSLAVMGLGALVFTYMHFV